MAAAVHMQNLRRIFQKSVESVQPANLLCESNGFFLQPRPMNGCPDVIQLHGNNVDISDKRCHLVGFGKAVLGMAVKLESCLGERLRGGVLSVPVGAQEQLRRNAAIKLNVDTRVLVFEGAPNNQPNENAVEVAKRIMTLASQMTADDVLFVLISGGGSALLPLPRESLSLTDKMELVRQLSLNGATISEMNVVRIALSAVKGGRLAAAAHSASAVISFIISDIVGDPVDLIASGPTAPVTQQESTARDVLEKYNLWHTLSDSIRKLVMASEGRDSMVLPENNFLYVVGNNCIAAAAAVVQATELGYNALVISTEVEGEVQHLVEMYAEFLQALIRFRRKEIYNAELESSVPFMKSNLQGAFFKALLSDDINRKPLLLILGGEPTVQVSGYGRGGRNQELALRMSLALHARPECHDVFFLSAGTDGFDGPTDAAGAFGGSHIIEEYMKAEGVLDALPHLHDYLRHNDSYNFYRVLNEGEFHLITGHTGTNVMDLQLILLPTG